MYRWYELLVDEWAGGTTALREQVESGKAHPKDLKVSLAELLVERFHGAQAAREGRAHFEQVFGRKELPDDIPEFVAAADDEGIWLPKLLQDAGLTKGSGEGRRLIKGGGVKLDGEKVSDENTQVEASGEVLIQVGKRRFLKVRFE